MENKLKSTALKACHLLLRPLVSILLKCGLTWKEFAEVAKWMFVDVATQEYGIKGRPTNMARISILTGITRKEVKRQREIVPSENVDSSKASDATRVLFAWHHDADFLDSSGQPKLLPIDSGSYSFAELHNRYGGDVSMQAMMKELLKTGSIALEETGNKQKLRILKKYFMPKAMEPEMLLHTGRVIRDHAQTLNNNIEQSDSNKKYFEGYAAMQTVDQKYQAEFHQFLKDKGQLFLEEVDAWLDQHQVKNNKAKPVRLGVGMYAIQSLTESRRGT